MRPGIRAASTPLFLFILLAGLAAPLLSGCGATVYKPYSGDVGYSEVNIAKNRYEVLFYAPSSMDDATAKKYAIVRAAEIGRDNGFKWFRIAAARTRQDTSKEIIRDQELFPAHPWTPEPRRMTYGEYRREMELERSRTRVRVDNRPVVQLTVSYLDGDCRDCLSVEAKLREAADEGLLKPKP